MSSTRRGCLQDDAGTVTIEMLLAFLPFLTLVLGILQLALMAAAQMGVRHAAVLAARAASVAVDDAPRFYGGEERKNLERFAGDGEWGSAERAMRPLYDTEPYLAGIPYGLNRRGSARLAQIRRAAIWGVAPFSSASDVVGPWFGAIPAQAFDPNGAARPPVMLRFGAAFMGYARAATAVTFPDEPGPGLQRVRVSYLFPCVIPLASRVICRRLAALVSAGDTRDVLENAEWGDALAAEASGARRETFYRVLTAEVTLPRVDAPYLYREEL